MAHGMLLAVGYASLSARDQLDRNYIRARYSYLVHQRKYSVQGLADARDLMLRLLRPSNRPTGHRRHVLLTSLQS